eukprot:7200508-Lingulodinium_polyedra.AAC.1
MMRHNPLITRVGFFPQILPVGFVPISVGSRIQQRRSGHISNARPLAYTVITSLSTCLDRVGST